MPTLLLHPSRPSQASIWLIGAPLDSRSASTTNPVSPSSASVLSFIFLTPIQPCLSLVVNSPRSTDPSACCPTQLQLRKLGADLTTSSISCIPNAHSCT